MPRSTILLLSLLMTLLPAMSHAQPQDAEPTATPAAGLPPPPAWLGSLDALYEASIRVDGLEDRHFTPEHWWSVAAPLAGEAAGFRTESIGQSAEGRPLRHVSWGEGATRVLLWSQMHGDESTASMAIADLFHFLGAFPVDPLVRRLRAGTTLHFFPIVNPDGAARFQRRALNLREPVPRRCVSSPDRCSGSRMARSFRETPPTSIPVA